MENKKIIFKVLILVALFMLVMLTLVTIFPKHSSNKIVVHTPTDYELTNDVFFLIKEQHIDNLVFKTFGYGNERFIVIENKEDYRSISIQKL